MQSLLNNTSSSAEYIFGAGSSLVELVAMGGDASHAVVALSNDLSFELAVLLILLIYLVWLGRSVTNLSAGGFRIANPFAKISKVSGLGGSIKIGDILLDWVLIIAMCALLATRGVDVSQQFTPVMAEFAYRITSLGIWLWMLAIGGAFLFSMLWGVVAGKIIGYALRCNWVDSGVILIKRRLLMMAVVWLLPIVLMSTLEEKAFFATYVAIFVAVIFMAIYLFRTFLLFTSQKISILHWILYLCAVEIVPVSLIWVIFVR